jgi:ATP-binding cassette subfamily B protein
MAGPRFAGRSIEKPRDFKKTMLRLLADFKPMVWKFVIVAFIVIGSVAFSIISPLFIRDILNNIANSPDMFFSISDTGYIIVDWIALTKQFAVVLIFYVGSALFSWLSEWLIIPISARYSYNLRKTFQAKIDTLPLNFFDTQTYGEILSKGTNDIDTIARSMQQIITQVIYSIFLFIGSSIAMFISSWQLALVAVASLPLTITFTILIAKHSRKRFKVFYKKLGLLTSHIEENYGGFKIVKLFNKEPEAIKKFNEINSGMAKDDRYSQFFAGIIFPTIHFINNLTFVGICVVGGLINDIGNMVAFFVLISLFQMPFQQIGQIANIIQSSAAAAERVFQVLDEPEVAPDPVDAITDVERIKGEVTFDKVWFSYKPDTPLIENMNLEIHPGESVAIVGPTGAGKTTIVNLIMRFYEVNRGSIKIDGIDIRNYSYEALRDSIGMVLQDTWLFSGSIKENIRYGRSSATDQEIVEAAEAAHAHFFITTLPDGYDFLLNEDGTNISQGQRQLITIARAILSQPKILILDEATSSVDTRTESVIQEAMSKLMENRTSFVIAHRLSTIKNAKTILVMRHGQIIETGTHEELLALNGFYADLYNAQFSGSNPLAPVDVEA